MKDQQEGMKHMDLDKTAVAPIIIINIQWSTIDVLDIAKEKGIDPDLAVARALEWGKYIEATAGTLVGEQLCNVIEVGQP